MKRLRVGVVFGGRSGEHEVSLRSAESVLTALDRNRYDAIPMAITPEGRWLCGGQAAGLLTSAAEIRHTLTSGQPLALVPEPGAPRPIDVVFPVLHGTYGEDGAIQGLLELADVPYVGAGVLGSAVGMDKDVMKRLLREAGLPVVEHWSVRSSQREAFAAQWAGRLPYPVFVKPANLGSSVGIRKVKFGAVLAEALDEAARFDRKIVIERGVDAREIELSVLGNEEPEVSVPGEIVPSREFYDYDAKYRDDNSKLLIPAPLSPEETRTAQRLAVRTFEVLDCSGMGRVDLFLERGTGAFFVNEINTLPGFTSISMYPKLWEASGLSYPRLLDRLIELAIERHEARRRLQTRFDG